MARPRRLHCLLLLAVTSAHVVIIAALCANPIWQRPVQVVYLQALSVPEGERTARPSSASPRRPTAMAKEKSTSSQLPRSISFALKPTSTERKYQSSSLDDLSSESKIQWNEPRPPSIELSGSGETRHLNLELPMNFTRESKPSLIAEALTDPRSNSPKLSFAERFAINMKTIDCVHVDRLPSGQVIRSAGRLVAKSPLYASSTGITEPIFVCEALNPMSLN